VELQKASIQSKVAFVSSAYVVQARRSSSSICRGAEERREAARELDTYIGRPSGQNRQSQI
jgi:hypothetical protein